jgi:hypothetical protein
VIGEETKPAEARQLLASHASLIQVESRTGALIEQDRQLIQRRFEAVRMKLTGNDTGGLL